jgi:hypothetical protein
VRAFFMYEASLEALFCVARKSGEGERNVRRLS